MKPENWRDAAFVPDCSEIPEATEDDFRRMRWVSPADMLARQQSAVALHDAALPVTPVLGQAFPDERNLVDQLAALPTNERFDVIRKANAIAMRQERVKQLGDKAPTLAETLALEKALDGDEVKKGNARLVGIAYAPITKLIRSVQIWDLRRGQWHGVEWRERRRHHLDPVPQDYDLRPDMESQSMIVIEGRGPAAAAWGIGVHLTTADMALFELGRMGWGVKRLGAFIRALRRTKRKKMRPWLRWTLLTVIAALALWIGMVVT